MKSQERYGIDCGKAQWTNHDMAGAQQRSSGCRGRELVSQHGCKVPCSLPRPALAQRPDRQRGTTDATVKGAASRVGAVAAPYEYSLKTYKCCSGQDMGYGVDAKQVESPSTPRCLWKL
ncbi:hypothetical protein GGI42DRAFT_71443 [Trichoderma sp. SZMC 28013]